MTAVEFLDEQKWISRKRNGLIIAYVVMSIIFILIARLAPFNRTDRAAALGFGVFMAGMVFEAMYSAWRRMKRINAAHPEMGHVSGWVELGDFEVRMYPVDPLSKTRIARDVRGTLEGYGRVATAAMVARDLIQAERDAYHKEDPEWIALDHAYSALSKGAEDANQQYLRRWRLYVDKMEVVAGSTAQSFRENLRTNKRKPNRW